MTIFLTIAEAVEKTGRSPSTIRRVIRGITDVADHADREGIEPKPSQVGAFKKAGENFAWKVREDVLLKHLKGALKDERKSERQETQQDILQILHKELEIKNQQIEKQWEVIHSLNDRLREGNILMGSLQKRLGPPVADPVTSAVDAATVPSSTEARQERSARAPVEVKATPARKGFLRWLRR